MRRSDLKTIFDSKAYGDFKNNKEAAHKVNTAIIERLDNVIRAIGSLGKVMGSR